MWTTATKFSTGKLTLSFVEQLTDENIPGHSLNLGEALDFADKVRSKEFTPRDVARGLKERISHTNPNVQILALQVRFSHQQRQQEIFILTNAFINLAVAAHGCYHQEWWRPVSHRSVI